MLMAIGMFFYLLATTTLICLAIIMKGVRSTMDALFAMREILAYTVGTIDIYLIIRFMYEYYREQYGFFQLLLNIVLTVIITIIICALTCGIYYALNLATKSLENLSIKCEWKATHLLVKTDKIARREGKIK